METTTPSSLEIAQAATLRPVGEIAAEAGLEPEEVEAYGRYKAKVSLSVLDRLADRPDAMPGYGKTPAAAAVDIDDEGRTVGLF